METKKILLYGGGAIILGTVGFFVWSFFKKVDVPLIQSAKSSPNANATNEDVKPINSGKNPFHSILNNTFNPIKTPNLKSDIDWLMTNS